MQGSHAKFSQKEHMRTIENLLDTPLSLISDSRSYDAVELELHCKYCASSSIILSSTDFEVLQNQYTI